MAYMVEPQQASHGVDTDNDRDIFTQAQRMSDENKQLLTQVRAPHVHTKGTWQRPEAGIAKINTDGATFCQERGAGLGVVIRDGDGVFITGLSRRTLGCFSAEVIEALAIQEGCLLAKDMGLSHIVIESDAQSVVQAVQMGRYEGPSVGNIIQSIVELLSSFPQGQIKYCPRESNKVAHLLARHVLKKKLEAHLHQLICFCFCISASGFE